MTQPDGVGALHISSARKREGAVLASEALSQLRENCPDGTETESARCGDGTCLSRDRGGATDRARQ